MSTQILKRKAIPHNKDNYAIEIIEVWISDDGTWEWFVLEKQQSGVLRVLVYSPYVPNGEFGTVYQKELESVGSITKMELSDSLPPTNYDWETWNKNKA